MNKPFDVLVPVEREGRKPLWNRVGVAFEGTKGLTLRLDAVPASNRLVVIAEELGQVTQNLQLRALGIPYAPGPLERGCWFPV